MNEVCFGETISNWDTSKLGLLSVDSPECRADSAPPFGGESPGVSRPLWRGGDEEIVDMDDMLGLSRCRVDIRRPVPLLSRFDWLERFRICP